MVSESCGLPSPSTNSDSNNFSASRLNRITNPVTSSNNPNIYSAVVINGNNNSSSSASPSNNLIQNNLINTMSHHIGNHSNNHSDHVPSAKVVGLILWPEGSFSVQQHSSNATLKPSSSSLSPFQSAFSKGLVLGSILLDSKESTMFADELRQLVTGQIPNITFGFLSKEGWPLQPRDESRVSATSIINESRFISLRSIFDKPRVGIVMTFTNVSIPVQTPSSSFTPSSVSCSSTPTNNYHSTTTIYPNNQHHNQYNEAIGFVFADHCQSVEKFRNDSIDPLLRELIINNNLVQRIPNVPDYKFLDSNDWPILRFQEDKLSLYNLLTHESNVRIQMKRTELAIIDTIYRYNGNSAMSSENGGGPSRQSDQGYGSDTTDHPKVLVQVQDAIRTRSMDNPSTYNSVDTFQLERTNSSKKKERKSSFKERKKPVTVNPKPVITKPIKSKSLAHPIMLSYARQEAANHALELKIELERLGYSAYLDVHEITSGDDWQDSLNYAVNNCVVFVPLVTPMYGNTQWTNREVKLADIKSKKIVPINFLDHWPPECLGIQFATTQYVTWLQGDDHGLDLTQADSFKNWPRQCIKRVAKALVSEVPKTVNIDNDNVVPAPPKGSGAKEKDTSGSGKQVKFTTPTIESVPILSVSTSSATATREADVVDYNNQSIILPGGHGGNGKNNRLVVISAHPSSSSYVNLIRTNLEREGFQVYSSTDSVGSSLIGSSYEDPGPGSKTGTSNANVQSHVYPASAGVTPTAAVLPTINEGQVSESAQELSAEYLTLARNLVASKQRPTSLPLSNTTFSGTTRSLVDGTTPSSTSAMTPRDKRPVSRVYSQISDVSNFSSLATEKKDSLKMFAANVDRCGVVIIVCSEEYFKSRTSKQHVYYCETRKKVIVVECDSRTPSWFTMLMNSQIRVPASSSRSIERIKGYVRRIMDPSAANSTSDDLNEAKIQYCVRIMKKNIEYLGTCVYVIGSTKLQNPRSEALCKELGKELAEVKNLTLVTSGFAGAQDLVAKSFMAALESSQELANLTHEQRSAIIKERIVHVLPIKDDQRCLSSEICSQNEDGQFEPMSYGKTLFLGESVSEREATLARLLDTCILIEGGPLTAHEVEEFIWNDHFVIPVISTGGAASGSYQVPLKIFELPTGVSDKDWRYLSNKEASLTDVSKAIVRIVFSVKKSIANIQLSGFGSGVGQTKEKKESSTSKFRSRFSRKSSKKRNVDRTSLDVSSLLTPITSDASNFVSNISTFDEVDKGQDHDGNASPEKLLPIVEVSRMANEIICTSVTTNQQSMVTNKKNPWKQVRRALAFKKNC